MVLLNLVWFYCTKIAILKVLYPVTTVPLNYNLILTRMSTSGATKYFTCQMPKFPVEICISTRRDVAFRLGIYTRRGILHTTES